MHTQLWGYHRTSASVTILDQFVVSVSRIGTVRAGTVIDYIYSEFHKMVGHTTGHR